MTPSAIQDYFSGDHTICYGCGSNNHRGLHAYRGWNGMRQRLGDWYPGVMMSHGKGCRRGSTAD